MSEEEIDLLRRDAVEDAIDEIAAAVFPDPSDDVVRDIYETSEKVMLATGVMRPIARGLSTLLAELQSPAFEDSAIRTVVWLRGRHPAHGLRGDAGGPSGDLGLYGTNFQQLPDLLKQPSGYPAMLAGTFIIEVVTWLRFRHRGWL
jgi:Mg2+ and Co2+ transporter CorA